VPFLWVCVISPAIYREAEPTVPAAAPAVATRGSSEEEALFMRIVQTRLVAATIAAAMCITWSFAQEVSLAEHQRWGPHLTDTAGASLYIYLADEGAAGSTCVDQCTANWPPVVVDGEPMAGAGVDAHLFGSIARPDGTMQLTYGGWPLYRFARDANTGDTRGQGLGTAFYLLSPTGQPIKQEPTAEEIPVDRVLFAALMTEGEQLFARNCAVCHGAEGQGVIGPSLRGMVTISSAGFIASTIIQGRTFHGMPAFGPMLSDREVAAIATFARNSWGNDYGLVDPEEVGQYR
jgi:predicted lipoprotein with Yx(FWY)xxD motif